MQYNKLLNNIERLRNVKEVLDANNKSFSDGDELFMQHLNADLNKFIDIIKVKTLESWQ